MVKINNYDKKKDLSSMINFVCPNNFGKPLLLILT